MATATMRRFYHSSRNDARADDTPVSHAKRQKRWVSPEQDNDDDDVSSVGSVDDSVSDVSQDDEYVCHAARSLQRRCLNLLQDREEVSLMKQAKLRDNLGNSPSQPNCRMKRQVQLLSDEKLKHGISKILSLLLQSHSIFGKLQEEQTKALLLVERFLEDDWDDAADIFLATFHKLLQRSVALPPHVIVVVSGTIMPSLATSCICGVHSPKQLCFDTLCLPQQQQRQRHLIDRLRDELQRLSLIANDLLHQRLAAPLDDNITDQLDAVEARTDILYLWGDLIQRQWTRTTDDALELFHDTLHPTVSVEDALWNFVYSLSLHDE